MKVNLEFDTGPLLKIKIRAQCQIEFRSSSIVYKNSMSQKAFDMKRNKTMGVCKFVMNQRLRGHMAKIKLLK